MLKKIFSIYTCFFLSAAIFFLLSKPAGSEFEIDSSATKRQLQNEYSPDSFIVKYKRDRSPDSLKKQVIQRQQKRDNLIGQLSTAAEDVIDSITGSQTPEQALQNVEQARSQSNIVDSQKLSNFDSSLFLYETDGSVPIEQAIEFFSDLDVEYVEPNYKLELFKTPNDTYINKLWGMQQIDAYSAWDRSTGSKDIKVAVIDSGTDGSHPDLAANIAEIKDFVSCPVQEGLLNHGTHVAGTIGAVANNSQGVAGVNWNVGLHGYRTACWGYDSISNRYEPQVFTSAVIEAIDYSAQAGIDVINLSLGGPSRPQALADAISRAKNKGIVIIAAAGNDGQANADSLYPASDPNVITVSAVGPNKELAKYSSYGNSVDVAAPGGNPAAGSSTCKSDGSDCIASTYPNNKYAVITGTSMAAPHVAGLAALILSVDPTLSPDQVQKIIEDSAQDLGTKGKDTKFGSGLINANSALAQVNGATNIPSDPPLPTISAPISITAFPTDVNAQPHFYIQPESQKVKKEEYINVIIGVDTGGKEVEGLDIVLLYDYQNMLVSNVAKITDQSQVKIVRANWLEAGRTTISAIPANYNSRIKGSMPIARIEFLTSKDSISNLDFACTPGAINDSNIASNSKDIINCAANKSASITVGNGSVLTSPTPAPTTSAIPTIKPLSPTITAQVTPMPTEDEENCENKKLRGDYDCTDSVNREDFEKWGTDYINDIITRNLFFLFEMWRRAFFNG